MDKIQKLIKRKSLEIFISSYLRVFLFALVVTLSILLTSSILYFLSRAIPLIIVFDLSIILCFAVALIGFPVISLFLKKRDVEIAAMLENSITQKHQYILNSIELTQSGQSGTLVHAVREKAAADLGKYRAVSFFTIEKKTVWVVLILSIINMALFIQNGSIINDALYPLNYFRKVKLTSLSDSKRVALNSNVILRCKVTPNVNANIKFSMKSLNSASASSKYLYRKVDSLGVVSVTLDSLSNDFEYRFSLGRYSSKKESLIVVSPPVLSFLEFNVFPPLYTGVKQFTTSGSFTAPIGSRVVLNLKSFSKLSDAKLSLVDRDTVNLSFDGNSARGSFYVGKSSYFTILLTDTLNQQSANSKRYYINSVLDNKPYVKIEKPFGSKLLQPSQIETLFVSASDEYAVKEINLFWLKKMQSEVCDSLNLYRSKKKEKSIAVSYIWNISAMNMYPGDSLGFYLTAKDNKSFGRENLSYTDTLFFKVPTLREIHKMVMEKEQSSEKSVESVLDIQKNVIKNIKDVMESSRFSKSMSWEQKEQLKRTSEMLTKSNDSLATAIDKMKKAVEKLKEAGLDKEIVSKMDEAGKELNELLKKYGRSAESLKMDKNISKKALQKRLEDLAQELPNLSKRLDETLKYLKFLKNEARRDMLSKESLKLASKQLDNISDSNTEKGNRKEDELLNEVDSLKKNVEKELSKYRELTGNKLGIKSQKLISESAKGLKNEAQSGENYSQDAMKDMAKSLQSLGNELQESLLKNRMKNRQLDADLLTNTAYSLMEVSKWQRELAERSVMSESVKNSNEENAILESVEKTINELNNLKSITPSTKNKINSQLSILAERMKQRMGNLYNNRSAFRAMKENSYDITAASSKLLSMAKGLSKSNGASSSGSGGIMGDMLRSLAGEQGAVNSATSQILQQLLKGGGSSQGAKPGNGGKKQGPGENGLNGTGEAIKAAQEAEKRIAKKLKEIEESATRNGSSEITKKQLSELKKEANAIAKVLSDPTHDLEYRQNRFLSRMLQTAVSLHKQSGKKKKRESKSALNVFSNTQLPERVGGNMNEDTYYKLRIKALGENIPDKYSQKINKYFDSIGKLYLK